LNGGVSWQIKFSSQTGTLTEGDVVTGLSSGATSTAAYIPYITTHHNIGTTIFGGQGGTYTAGETVSNGAGWTGVIEWFELGDHFDDSTQTGHIVGCACDTSQDLCATGPSSTKFTQVLLLYSLDQLDAIKNNTATDYLTVPIMINMNAAPFSLPLPTNGHALPAAGGFGPGGGWVSSAKKKLYIVAHGQDQLGLGQYDSVILRFSINDSAAPIPIPPPLTFPFATMSLSLLSGIKLRRKYVN
jgi:hypothetical protein